jgi:hypothetical protein
MREAQRAATIVGRARAVRTTLPAALETSCPAARESAGRRRALVQELCYGTLRHWGLLDALVRSSRRSRSPIPRSSCLVAVAIYQLCIRGRRRLPSWITR